MKRHCSFGGKVAYKSEEHAKEIRKTLRWKGKLSGGEQRVYRCPNCFRFHLTKSKY